jgi:hypothetical protein
MPKKKIARQFRQGDLLLQPIEKIPASARAADPKSEIVLAEGEATGHAHRIKPPWENRAKQYFDGPTLYLEVLKPVAVDHEEHGAITIPPGCYERRLQTETWMDEVRQVAD